MLKKVWWIVVLVTHPDYWERKSTLINFFWIYICSTYNLVLRNPLRQNKYSFLSVFYGYIFLSLDIESILKKKKTCIIVFWCNIQVQVQNESPKSRHHSLSFVFKCTLQNAFIGFEKGFCSPRCSHVAAAGGGEAAESCWGMMLKNSRKMTRILKVSPCCLAHFQSMWHNVRWQASEKCHTHKRSEAHRSISNPVPSVLLQLKTISIWEIYADKSI